MHALAHDDPSRLSRVDVVSDDALADDDVQLALWTCFELSYRGFADVTADLEWHPAVLELRRELEDAVLAQLMRELPTTAVDDVRPDDVATRLFALVAADDGPSVAGFVHREARVDQVRELAIHRSIYQLKEADPHSWAIPRLDGRAKAALIEIQSGEYGNGVPSRMHSQLFRATLHELGLDGRYGGYVDAVPAITLAITNVISVFGMRRSLVGALCGHLAAYEMTSSEPSRKMAAGLRRLGFGDAACRFYDEHVTADALHEQLAAHDLCATLAATHPGLARTILFGAAAGLYVDRRFGEHVLGCFRGGRPSLVTATGERRSA